MHHINPDNPYEGPPRYHLRCWHCGRTHPPCNFYPIGAMSAPPGYGIGGMGQLCNDCDSHLREGSRVIATLEDAIQELLRGGEHDGPCDEGSEWDGCEQHLAAASRRREYARRVLVRDSLAVAE